MTNRDILKEADARIQQINDAARLTSPELMKGIVKGLQLPGLFPSVLLEEHGRWSNWHEVKALIQIDAATLESAATPSAAIHTLFTGHIVNDMTELMIDGDTEAPEDSLLQMFDGLKKRTQWPEAFAISDLARIKAEQTDEFKTISIELTMYIRPVEQSEL